jgi:putative FmdB family regulatory protein
MPIYEFACKTCGKITEHLFKVSDLSATCKCECGSVTKKIISRIGMINMNSKPLSGVDDTDELTLGKIVANKGLPAEHKRKYAEARERRKKVLEYEQGLRAREKKYKFTSETKTEDVDRGT